jgi:hypothetical protein
MEWAVYETLNASPEYNFGFFLNGGCAAVLGAFLGKMVDILSCKVQYVIVS